MSKRELIVESKSESEIVLYTGGDGIFVREMNGKKKKIKPQFTVIYADNLPFPRHHDPIPERITILPFTTIWTNDHTEES